jgi:hypothetical protein
VSTAAAGRASNSGDTARANTSANFVRPAAPFPGVSNPLHVVFVVFMIVI